MAGLRKSFFGYPVGKLAGLVFKTRYGKPYVATEPVFTEPITSPAVIAANIKFTFMAKLTSAMNNEHKLKCIWKDSPVPKREVRHKISHINNSIIDNTWDLTRLKLVPYDDLFPVEVIDKQYGQNLLTITAAPFTHKHNGEPYLSARGVIRYFDCTAPDYPDLYKIEPASSAPVPYRKGEPHTFVIQWDSRRETFLREQFCLTLVIENNDGIPTMFSENIIV